VIPIPDSGTIYIVKKAQMATSLITLIGNRQIEALVIFNGGHAAIIVDDGCYLLMLRVQPSSGRDPRWVESAWWFPEAVAQLKSLPNDPSELLAQGVVYSREESPVETLSNERLEEISKKPGLRLVKKD
jgi:hypothetical protein